MWGELSERQALVAYFGTLMDIRPAGRRIIWKLKMAGVTVTEGDRYMFNAMPAAMAGKWKEVEDVLQEGGMHVPKGVENAETKEDAQDELAGETVASLFRVRRSYRYQERTRNGGVFSSRSAMMPLR